MMRALLALVLLGSAAAFTPSMRPARAATSTTSLAAKSKSVPFLEQPAIGEPVFPVKLPFWRTGDDFLRYTDPQGTTWLLDITAVAPGGGVYSAGDIGLRTEPTADPNDDPAALGDYTLYFRLNGVPSAACTMLHDDDDEARPGWYFATDSGSTTEVDEVWGSGDNQTFILAREGVETFPIGRYDRFYILCF